MSFDDSQSDWIGHQQQEQEQQQVLDHLLDLWELSGMLGKQESVFVIAERCGMLNEFKQVVANKPKEA